MFAKELKFASKKLLMLSILISILLVFVNRFVLSSLDIIFTPAVILTTFKIIILASAVILGLTLFNEEFAQNTENYLYSIGYSRLQITFKKIFANVLLVVSALLILETIEQLWFPPGNKFLTVAAILPSQIWIALMISMLIAIPLSYFKNTATRAIIFAGLLVSLTPILHIIIHFVFKLRGANFNSSPRDSMNLLTSNKVALSLVIIALLITLYLPFIRSIRKSGGIHGRYTLLYLKNLLFSIPFGLLIIVISLYFTMDSGYDPYYAHYILKDGNTTSTGFYVKPTIKNKTINMPGYTQYVTGSKTLYFKQTSDSGKESIYSYDILGQKLQHVYASKTQIISFNIKIYNDYLLFFEKNLSDNKINLTVININNLKKESYELLFPIKYIVLGEIIHCDSVTSSGVEAIISVVGRNSPKQIIYKLIKKDATFLGDTLKHPFLHKNILITFTQSAITFSDINNLMLKPAILKGQFTPPVNYRNTSILTSSQNNYFHCLINNKELIKIDLANFKTQKLYSVQKTESYLQLYQIDKKKSLLVEYFLEQGCKLYIVTENIAKPFKIFKNNSNLTIQQNGLLIENEEVISTLSWNTIKDF